MSVHARKDVGALTGMDLSGDGWLKQARLKRARAVFEPEVIEEVSRLVRRVAWLRRKAARLPIGNGKSKTLLEAARLQALAALLPAALSPRPIQKFPPVGSRHEQRAIRLLNELADVA